MRVWSGCRGSAGFVAAALLSMTVLACGCSRLPDEAWLRFLGFRSSATGGTGSWLTTLSGELLRDGKDSTVDAVFENRSHSAGGKEPGAGIFVYRARVEYYIPGFSPPAADLPLNLYLAPPAAGATDEQRQGTLTGFPLAPAWLKLWLLKTHRFDDADRFPIVSITARVTFYAVTDEGTELQTTGGIGITLTNTQEPADEEL